MEGIPNNIIYANSISIEEMKFKVETYGLLVTAIMEAESHIWKEKFWRC